MAINIIFLRDDALTMITRPVRHWLAVIAWMGLIHQSFVPSRTASPGDVVIDVCSASLGLALAFVWTRRSPHVPPNPSTGAEVPVAR